MDPVVATKIALAVKQQSKKPGFWIALVSIILIPIILCLFVIVSITTVITGFAAYFNDGLPVYQDAAKAVALELAIDNDISAYLIKALWQNKAGYIEAEASQAQAQEFIKRYLVLETSHIVKVPVKKPEPFSSNTPSSAPSQSSSSSLPPEIEYEEITVYEYSFYTAAEISMIGQQNPFSITSDDMQIICALAFEPVDGLGSGTGTFQNPVIGTQTSPYGARIHPTSGAAEFHYGMDIAASWHADVYAITDGTVYRVSSDSEYGNSLMIQHEKDGEVFYAFYVHLSAITVNNGDVVTAGQAVGKEGGQPGADLNPGNSTGHHLHFEIRLTPALSSHTNPLAYIKGY